MKRPRVPSAAGCLVLGLGAPPGMPEPGCAPALCTQPLSGADLASPGVTLCSLLVQTASCLGPRSADGGATQGVSPFTEHLLPRPGGGPNSESKETQ